MTASALNLRADGDDETTRLLVREKTTLADSSAKPPVQLAHRSIMWTVCVPILCVEFSLWLCLATLVGAVPIFLRKHLDFDSVLVTELNYAQQSLTNLTPILGGYLADKYFGRYHTIIAACGLFTVGMAMITVATHPSIASKELLLLGLLGVVPIAQGGTAPCIVVFGADQFHPAIPSQQREKESFFNWFYWAINMGSFLSFALLSNLAVDGLPPIVPERMGFFTAFAIATLAFVAGSVYFIAGRRNYRRLPRQGSNLTDFFAVLWHVCTQSHRGQLVLSGGLAFVPGIVLTTTSYFVDTEPAHMVLAVGGAASVLYGSVVLIFTCQSTHWVTLSEHPDTGQLQDVRQVLRILPFMATLVMFWAIYSQMETNFILQGCQMDLRIGQNNNRMISSAMLTILDSGVVLLFIPVFDRIVYPWLRRRGIEPTMLRKIGAGVFFSMAAMACAAYVEVLRKRRATVAGVSSNCVDTSGGQPPLPMAEMSIWWHTPQYLLVGISEILASITSYDLFYSEVPESMRSACQSLNLLTTTLGYIVAGAVNSIFSFWIPSDLNEGRMEYIFGIMAVLAAVCLALFVPVARKFEYAVDTSQWRPLHGTAAA